MVTGKASGRRLSVSLVVGLLLVPLAAVAAVAILNPQAKADTGLPEASIPTVVPWSNSAPAEQRIVMEPVTSSAEDLAAACGPDGQVLVDLEASGTASDIQQAALDALRQLCEGEGMPLPDPPAPPPVVKTVASEDNASADTDSGEYEDHEDEEDEHEEDEEDHEEDEHEEDEEDEKDH